MIKIENVEIKQTKTNKNYKHLTLENGIEINMWWDDADYDNTEIGTELDREIEQNGKFWNLVSTTHKTIKKESPVKSDDINKKLDAIYWVLQEIAKVQGITPKVEDTSAIDPETNINTEDIPF